MTITTRSSVLALIILSLGLTSVACADTTDDDASNATIGEGEDAFTVDIPKSERLLAEAVKLAERHAAKGCDGDGAYLVNVVAKVEQAIAARDTVWFRTRVIPTKPALVKELTGTLAWQRILGVYDPKKPDTFVAAANAGFSFWDLNGGAFGNQRRFELARNGKATLFVLDPESKDFHWNATATTWSYRNGKLTVGGKTYSVVGSASGELWLKDASGASWFISRESECEA